jgi:hypothetical protein
MLMRVREETQDDWWTLLVVVNGTEPCAPGRAYADWMNQLRAVIDAGAIAFTPDRPWTVGDHRSWRRDTMTGGMVREDTPYANVWQQIKGVPSLAMAYCYAALYLVAPLDAAGYSIGMVHAIRTRDMVLLA